LNAVSNQEFKGRFGDTEIEAAVFEPLQFLRNGKGANFTLYVVGERFEMSFSSKRPINSGRKNR
jgi:hypothetical protein